MAKKARAKKKAEGASVIDTDKFSYETTKVRGKDGKIKHSKNNGDAIAKAFTVFLATGKDIMQVVRANKLTERLKGRDVNSGLFRMTLGVILRGMVRKGEHVQIGDVTVKSLEQRVAVPEIKEKPTASAKKPRAKKASAPKKERKARKPRASKPEMSDAASHGDGNVD